MSVEISHKKPSALLPKKSDQPNWVKDFRKAVKASTPKGWLVMPGRKESMRVQVWKNKKIIGDVTIPYAWRESDWPDALLRIRSAAKAYEESNQKLEIKTCFNISHTVSSKNDIDWKGALDAYRKYKGKKVKDSHWEKKYMPVLIDFEHKEVNGQRVYKYKEEKDAKGKVISRKKIPCSPSNIERLARKHSNSKTLCKAALKRWEQGTTQHRHMRLALYGFLRYCVQDLEFESVWFPPAVTDKDAVEETKRTGYNLTDAQILRLLDSFPENDTGNKWRFAFQCMAVYGLRPEDLRHLQTRNSGTEIWSNYKKSKGGTKGKKTDPRRLHPLFVHDVDGAINWHLKEQLYICEQEGRSMLPPLGKEGNAAGACKTYLERRKVWDAIKKEVQKKDEVLTVYSFRHRYVYYGHNRPKKDGSYRAPKSVADALGHSLDVHLTSYSRYMTRNLQNEYDDAETPVKVAS